MSYCLKTAVLILVFTVSLSVNGIGMDDKVYEKKMINNIKQASVWIIKNGVKVYCEKGKKAIHRKLVDKWGVQIWVDPWVETERYLAQFRIKARGINYDIHNLHRVYVDNYYYEFWVVKVAAKEWSGESDHSNFYITKTKNIYGNREIVKESDQFMDSYVVKGEAKITFPVDNLKLLYDLQPWLFPENYKNSNLDNKKVVVDKNGQFVLDE